MKIAAPVTAHDPAATQETPRVLQLDLADQPQGLERTASFALLRRELAQPLVFDGRNLYSPQRMPEEGIEYFAVGRSASSALRP